MNHIDLYISEVGEHLPAKLRADLQAEIRSLIEDTLEDRSQAAGRTPDEAMVLEVLKSFGPPADVAASYLPPRYLIGPRLFPTFLLVMRIVLTVLVVLALIRLGVAVTPDLPVEAIVSIVGEQFVSLLGSALAALGNIVFIFAILEWLMPKTAEKKEDWDPRSLKPRAETERVRPSLLIFEMGVVVGMILLLNVYADRIGIYYVVDGVWRMVPVLSDAFFRYVPLMTVAWALQIGLNVMLLRQGFWTRSTRWFQIAIKALNMVILGMIIAGPSILNPQFGQMDITPEAVRSLEPLANQGFRVLLIGLLVLSGWELVQMLYRLFAKQEIPLVIE